MSHLEALNGAVGDAEGPEIELARGLAGLLDAGVVAADIWREYRFALKAVREALRDDDAPSEPILELIGRLGGADVRDAADAG